ncbi:MAG: 50S ribosomal protein L18 [Candidatus Woesearchaeota archaeon]
MAKNSIYTVKYRRKREGRTYYKKRLELLKSGKPRLVVRKTNAGMVLQVVDYHPDGDKVLSTFHSKNLDKYGWNFSKKSIPASYLAGLAMGVKAKEKVSEAILDLGLQSPAAGTRLYAALKGVIDAGLEVPCSDSVFPSDDRIRGEHIAQGAKVLESKATAYKKDGLKMEDLPATFDKVKEKILA